MAGRQLAVVRFRAHVQPTTLVPVHAPELGPCSHWTGTITKSGYGRFTADPESARRPYVHKWLYEQLHGPVPAGWTVDHLCHHPDWCPGGPGCIHRRCVSLRHLNAVPFTVNVLRGAGPTAVNARKLVCDGRGRHPLVGDNVYSPPKRPGQRHCRACQRAGYGRYAVRQRHKVSDDQMQLPA